MKRKKQHYIPKFYLKNFSLYNNNKKIGIYNLENKIFITNGDLKNQAKENYFYDLEGEVENFLSIIENYSSNLFYRIIKKNKIPEKKSDDYLTLLIFVVQLMLRTKHQANLIDEMINKFHESALDEKLNIDISNSFSLSLIYDLIPLIYDLNYKILYNNTKISFLTSDNPVVRYNQFLEKRNINQPITSLKNIGLQIFLPISPNKLILFYDGATYKVGNRKEKIVDLNLEEDVNKLNMIQLLNCENHLYFNENIKSHYLDLLFEDSLKHKNSNEIDVKKHILPTLKEESKLQHSIIHAKRQDLKTGLNISKIKELKKAKNLIFKDRFSYYR